MPRSTGDHISMDVPSVLAELGGSARRKELAGAGLTGTHLNAALARGEIVRPALGVYALPRAEGNLLTANCAKAELACISAASQRGLWILQEPRWIHVSVNHSRPLGDKFRIHRAQGPLSIADICVQCLRCLPELHALCIVESAVVKHLISPRELRQVLPGKHDVAARAVVELIDPHSQSIIETVARYRLRKVGLNTQSQVYVPGAGRLDLYVEGELGIEADGRDHHSGPEEFAEDRRRWNVLTVGGIRVLRVTYAIIVHQPELFLKLVYDCLGIPPEDRWR